MKRPHYNRFKSNYGSNFIKHKLIKLQSEEKFVLIFKSLSPILGLQKFKIQKR
jgi:hypothetical protein